MLKHNLPLKCDLLALLAAHGQEHLLRFWDALGDLERESLSAELRQIDFALLARLRAGRAGGEDVRALADRAASPRAFRLGEGGDRFSPEDARQAGAEALQAGRIGAMLVAGGQGTRLGADRPKGMFPIGPVSGKSLFHWHAEKIVAVMRRYGTRLPWYVMTSPATHAATVDFFAQHGRFGFPAEDLQFFCQGTMPAVDRTTGKVLLAEPHQVALSPDGHGGMLAAFHGSGALADARRRGVEHLFYFQVDNPLVDVCSPEFLGYHLLSGSEFSTQVVRKREPLDRVGNVVEADGRLRVIEYSDLPDEVARRRNPDGSLAIWAGSIAVHAMETAFLERMAGSAEALPFHSACKKVAYVDSVGKRVEPEKPNAVKFERFIFDLMPAAQRAILVEIDPAEHFAPLKNAPGSKEDSPEMVKARLVALHARWLRQAGAEVADGVDVEIGPLWALDAAEVARKLPSGTRITKPTYFGE
jgi:UDP-N-acetylglucosamine/UDP-N-acetylgalactosamine diphosphorylase